MANWVSYVRAKNFPAIKNVFKRPTQFKDAIKLLPAWARFRSPAVTIPASDADWQVDVDAPITGVRPLWPGGAKKT